MSKTALLILPLALTVVAAPAGELRIPDIDIPELAAAGADVDAFVPPGWAIESRLDGRIDSDARPDAVLLLRANDPRNVLENDGLGTRVLDTNPRMLVVLGAAAGGYRLVAQDALLIPRNENPVMSDPLEDGGLSLRDRVLKVRLGSFTSAGSWSMGSTTFSFRHQDGCMRLIGHDALSLHRGSGEVTETSVNLLTGRAIVRVGSIESDATRERKAPTTRRGRVCLEDVGDGFSFDTGIPTP